MPRAKFRADPLKILAVHKGQKNTYRDRFAGWWLVSATADSDERGSRLSSRKAVSPDVHKLIGYDTIPYDIGYRIFTCAQKLTGGPA